MSATPGPIDFFIGRFDGAEDAALKFLAMDRRGRLLVGFALVTVVERAVKQLAAVAPVLTGATRWAMAGKVVRGTDVTTAIVGPKHARITLQTAATARGKTKLVGTRVTKTGRVVRVKVSKTAIAHAGKVVDPANYDNLVEAGHGGKAPAPPHPWFSTYVREFIPVLIRAEIEALTRAGFGDDMPELASVTQVDSIATLGAFAGSRYAPTTRAGRIAKTFGSISGNILRAKLGAFASSLISRMVIARAAAWREAREANRHLANESYQPAPFTGLKGRLRATAEELAHFVAERAKFDARAPLRAAALAKEPGYLRHDVIAQRRDRAKAAKEKQLSPFEMDLRMAIRRKIGPHLIGALRAAGVTGSRSTKPSPFSEQRRIGR